MCEVKKLYLFFATLVTGLAGIGMISLGKEKLKETSFLDAFLSDYVHVGRTFISLGCLLFLIAFIGMAGVMLHLSILLQIYAALMLMLVLTQITVGAIIFSRMEIIMNTLNRTLEEKYRAYQQYKMEIDKLQSFSKCCGMYGPKEWKIKKLPPSCCGLDVGSCTLSSAFDYSCSSNVASIVKISFYFVAIVCFVLILVELKCVTLACFMSDPCALFNLCVGLVKRREEVKEP